jgi:hypothetical protein
MRTGRNIGMLAGALAFGLLAAACVGGGSRKSSTAGEVPSLGGVAPGSPSTTATSAPGTSGVAGQAGVSAGAGVPSASGAAVGQPVSPAQARIVRNGSLQIDIGRGHLQSAFDQAETLATGSGGFVADSSMSTADGVVPSATLTLRVPSDHLAAVINALSQVGTIHQQDLKGEDVTGLARSLTCSWRPGAAGDCSLPATDGGQPGDPRGLGLPEVLLEYFAGGVAG